MRKLMAEEEDGDASPQSLVGSSSSTGSVIAGPRGGSGLASGKDGRHLVLAHEDHVGGAARSSSHRGDVSSRAQDWSAKEK